jgi:hypothetical protein
VQLSVCEKSVDICTVQDVPADGRSCRRIFGTNHVQRLVRKSVAALRTFQVFHDGDSTVRRHARSFKLLYCPLKRKRITSCYCQILGTSKALVNHSVVAAVMNHSVVAAVMNHSVGAAVMNHSVVAAVMNHSVVAAVMAI